MVCEQQIYAIITLKISNLHRRDKQGQYLTKRHNYAFVESSQKEGERIKLTINLFAEDAEIPMNG